MASGDDEVHSHGTEEEAGDLDSENEEPLQELPTGLGALLAQLEAASEQLDEVVEPPPEVIVEGTSAGGAVVVQLTTGLEAVSLHIDPALLDPPDVAMLEDAVLAALRDGLGQVVELQQEVAGDFAEAEIDLSGLLGKLGGLATFGGLGLPDLGNLSSPEDLIAGLSGALGNLSGALGNDFPGNLSDIMGGLGLPGPPREPAGSEQVPAVNETDSGDAGSPAES